MGIFSSGGGNVDTGFSRSGTTTSTQTTSLPTFLDGLITNHALWGQHAQGLVPDQDTFLSGLFDIDPASVRGQSALDSAIALDPNTFTGSSALGSIAAQDPYSDTYRAGIESYYDDAFSQAAAAARTGPEAVRGGVAHGGYASAGVLEKAALDKFRALLEMQQQQAGVTSNAAQVLQAIAQARRGSGLQAQNQWQQQYLGGLGTGLGGSQQVNQALATQAASLASAAGSQGSRTGQTIEGVSGKGGQTSSHAGWQAGLQCCFIFLEALNGQLPWYVRDARDRLCTPKRLHGYRSMSRWLVPLMQEHTWVKRLVNGIMIQPFLKWGAYLYKAEGYKRRWRLWSPLCQTWFKLWDKIGG